MRIAFLLLHDLRFAGIDEEEFAYHRFHFAKEYARRMANRGHEVTLYLLSNRVGPIKRFWLDNYQIKSFGATLKIPPFGLFGNNHSLRVLREIREDNPDIIHYHNYYLWSFPYVAPWVRSIGVPLVAQFHGSDPLRTLKGAAFTPSLRLCDRVLVPTLKELNFLTTGLRIPSEKVDRFPSTGVDPAVFSRTDGSPRGPSFLYVGRIPRFGNFRWEKSPQYLPPIIRALRRTGIEARLTVVGDGPGISSLSSGSSDLSRQDAIEFMGHIEHSELPSIYSNATFTFVPFEIDEIGPYWDGAQQESLACGTPVIGFNRTPRFEPLGMLVPIDSGEAAAMISDAISDRARFDGVREKGPRAIREVCDWDVMMDRLESTYGAVAR